MEWGTHLLLEQATALFQVVQVLSALFVIHGLCLFLKPFAPFTSIVVIFNSGAGGLQQFVTVFSTATRLNQHKKDQ